MKALKRLWTIIGCVALGIFVLIGSNVYGCVFLATIIIWFLLHVINALFIWLHIIVFIITGKHNYNIVPNWWRNEVCDAIYLEP